MRVYYAHPMSWYDTPEEAADVAALEAAGHEVLNPNNVAYAAKVQDLRARGLGHMVMEPFMRAVGECDALAYRPFKDGRLGAGVAKELMEAIVLKHFVIRLPHLVTNTNQGRADLATVLTIEETRERIRAGVL